MNIRIVSACCLLLASLLYLGAANKADQSKTSSKKPWPGNRDEVEHVKGAVDAFTATLTRSGYDRTFRNSLTASPESAKKSVSDEGRIDIPNAVLILFYEPEAYENYWAFYLPPFDESAQPVDNYWHYHQCCLPKFRLFALTSKASLSKTTARKQWNPENARTAFTAALTRSQRDRDFRNSLTAGVDSAGLESAKMAVAKEGNIDIPKEIVIVFHEDELNEKYHIFSLPPFNPNSRTEHKYRKHFMGLYWVW